MSYIYIQSEKPCEDNGYHSLYTVGFYMPDGKFEPESDHRTIKDAASRVNYLNGGNVNYDI